METVVTTGKTDTTAAKENITPGSPGSIPDVLKTYEDCARALDSALNDPSKAEGTLRKLQTFFAERIARSNSVADRDGMRAVKHNMQGKFKSYEKPKAPEVPGAGQGLFP